MPMWNGRSPRLFTKPVASVPSFSTITRSKATHSSAKVTAQKTSGPVVDDARVADAVRDPRAGGAGVGTKARADVASRQSENRERGDGRGGIRSA